MIAITFALPVESSDFRGRLRDKATQTRNGSATIRGKIDKQEIELLHTGVGKKVSTARLENFLRTAQPKYLVSSGFAGGVREDFEIGDLIVAENFSDRELLSAAAEVLRDGRIHIAKLFTSVMIADSIAERNEIARNQDAAAVDMETETIAQVCAARGIPLLSLRVISDTAGESFPAPPGVLFDIERQRTNMATLAIHFLKHPAALPRLIRFSRQIARARERLTDALVAVLRSDGI